MAISGDFKSALVDAHISKSGLPSLFRVCRSIIPWQLNATALSQHARAKVAFPCDALEENFELTLSWMKLTPLFEVLPVSIFEKKISALTSVPLQKGMVTVTSCSFPSEIFFSKEAEFSHFHLFYTIFSYLDRWPLYSLQALYLFHFQWHFPVLFSHRVENWKRLRNSQSLKETFMKEIWAATYAK